MSKKEKHFSVKKSVLWIDILMSKIIPLGGIFVIVVIFGIFGFILSQVFPLFEKPQFEQKSVFSLPQTLKPKILGSDEWGELPFIYDGGKEIFFFHPELKTFSKKTLIKPRIKLEKEVQETPLTEEIKQVKKIATELEIIQTHYDPSSNTLSLLLEDGSFEIHQIIYNPEFDPDLKRTITASVAKITFGRFEIENKNITSFSHIKNEDGLLIGIISHDTRNSYFSLKKFETASFSLGDDEESLEEISRQDIIYPINEKEIRHFILSETFDSILVQGKDNRVYHYSFQDEEFELVQEIQIPKGGITSINFIQGGASFICSMEDKSQIGYTILQGKKGPRYVHFKTFEKLPEKLSLFAISQRNKTFFCAGKSTFSIRYNTTEDTRLTTNIPFSPKLLSVNEKGNIIVFLSSKNELYFYHLKDEHPQSGFSTFFKKIWYERLPEADWNWQSTGGSDQFEPKFSLIPLFFGSLKGTFYAMLFSVPIAISAAIYTSQFIHWRFRNTIKSTMEVMASIPSVVLGFLGALWIAPIFEPIVPSIMLICIGTPLSILFFSLLWNRTPTSWQERINGWEWILLIPLMLLFGNIFFLLGPGFEEIFFNVREYQIVDSYQGVIETLQGKWIAKEKILELTKLYPEYSLSLKETGEKLADFRLWWSQEAGVGSYNQRNSLVVGLVMGVAVIPIIFTISEDALSNVPKSLKSASMALGASDWQTTSKIILPIAFGGIFSAIMIGFGRAIGETIIVVMATGNTPILEWNIFSGMRTLSANIAMELPEAPEGGTHYRTLFFGSFLLFIFTFLINTVAELVRQRISRKYKGI